jgi:hypothetical protein
MAWRRGVYAGFTVTLLVLACAGPAIAQYYAGSCPRGQKFAAGACVTSCPAGYSDQGSYCRLRNMGD